MYYCSDFLTRPVLSLYEGELVGNVDKLLFDRKLKKLLFLEITSENDTHFLLPTKNIYNVGKNAITIKNNLAVSLKIEDENYSSCPVGSKAFNIKGEFLGVVKEIIISEKYLTEKLSLENSLVLDADMIASSGKNTVIFYDKLSKVDVSKFVPNKTPKTFKTKHAEIATILPVLQNEVTKATDQTATQHQATNQNIVSVDAAPTLIQNSDFLIGKICTKDIFNFNNELLIKAHSVVNKKNLKEINRYGKLRELMLYCK